MPWRLVDGKRKRMRVSRPGKRVTNLPINLPPQNLLKDSQIKSFHGESGVSFGTGVCSTVIAQVSARRKEPVTVIWHAYPPHVLNFQFYFPSKYDHKAPGEDWRTSNIQREQHGELLRRLRSNTLHSLEATQRMHPESVVDAIVTHLNEERGKWGTGKVSITLIPGNVALKASMTKQAFQELRRMFREQKENGRVDNIHTHGMSVSKGSGHVIVMQSGRIHRLKLTKETKTKT